MSKTVTIGDITGPEGHWMVVVGGKVVASSDNVRKMLELAEKYPPEDTIVTRVLYPQASFYQEWGITKLVDFRFNYKRIVALDPATRTPILDSNTGRPMEAYHPMIPCIISSEKRTSPQIEGLLDSGSDGIVIPRGLADYLELELKPADRPMRVANGRSVERYTSKASLTIGRGGRHCDPVEAEVSVPAEGDPPILIGREPIFRLFVITFVEAEKRFEMRPWHAK